MGFWMADALAQEGGGGAAAPGAGAGLDFLIMIIIFFALLYFMIIRPQSKRAKEHKKLVESLSKGDEVVTNGGVLGKVTNVGDTFIRMEVSEGVEIVAQKQSVASVMPKGTMKNA